MDTRLPESLLLLATVALVALDGFFVAAEFALVRGCGSWLAEMARQEELFAMTAQWGLDRSLSACQLGITTASLGLGNTASIEGPPRRAYAMRRRGRNNAVGERDTH